MIRAAILAISLIAAGGASAQEFDLSGDWRGEISPTLRHPPYFSASLTQSGDDLQGEGVSNRCPRCRGFDEIPVRWEGRIEGREISLTARHPDRPWEEDRHYEGVLSEDGRTITGAVRGRRRTETFVMTRVEEAP